MTRYGRRSLSEGARVVRVARERDDISRESPAAGVPAGEVSRRLFETSRADRLPRSHLRVAIEDAVVRATGRLPAATRTHLGPIGLTRRASDGFDWNAPTATRPPRELHRKESASAENRKGEDETIRIGRSP